MNVQPRHSGSAVTPEEVEYGKYAFPAGIARPFDLALELGAESLIPVDQEGLDQGLLRPKMPVQGHDRGLQPVDSDGADAPGILGSRRFSQYGRFVYASCQRMSRIPPFRPGRCGRRRFDVVADHPRNAFALWQ